MTDIEDRLEALKIIDEVGSDNPLGRDAAALIRELRNEIARLHATSEWRDISTAPRDGRNVSVHSHDLGTVTAYWQIRTGKWIVVCSNWEVRPTHWQPLPAPPQRNEVIK